MFDIKEAFSELKQSVPMANAVLNEVEVGDPSIIVDKELIVEVCKKLRDGKAKFHSLQVISGVDYSDHVEVNYILANFLEGHEMILKTKVAKETDSSKLPEIPSVTSVWSAANFQERETFDMLGVNFIGHPDLRRILCGDDWEGFPLRKDYVAAKEYHGMVIYPEAKSNKADIEYANEVKAQEKKKLEEEKLLKEKMESVIKKQTDGSDSSEQ